MSAEIIRCSVCRTEYEANGELASYLFFCPTCNRLKPKPQEEKKPLDKVFETLMPYGKYRGQPFYKIPDSYLEWLEQELLTGKDGKKETADLLEKITAELKRRQANPKARV